jgi:hypothetical protein
MGLASSAADYPVFNWLDATAPPLTSASAYLHWGYYVAPGAHWAQPPWADWLVLVDACLVGLPNRALVAGRAPGPHYLRQAPLGQQAAQAAKLRSAHAPDAVVAQAA